MILASLSGFYLGEFNGPVTHIYYQYKKLHMHTIESIHSKALEWHTANGDYTYNPHCKANICPLHNLRNYYITIADSVLDSLDPQLRETFIRALENSRIARDKGQNGVKIFGNLAELKITGDVRLFTHTIYDDGDGHYLIIFDRIGTHRDIKKSVSHTKGMEVLDGSIDHADDPYLAQKYKQANEMVLRLQSQYEAVLQKLLDEQVDQSIYFTDYQFPDDIFSDADDRGASGEAPGMFDSP